MNHNIALYMKYDGSVASFLESEKIVVYQSEASGWRAINEFPIAKVYASDISSLRTRAQEVVRRLDSCRILAGLSLSGISYGEFDRAGFFIFDIAACSPDVFDTILHDIASSDEESRLKCEIIKNARPAETAVPGIYYLDLIALQTECPEVSSKQAIRNFLEDTPFMELRLICNHLPPWLENGDFDIRSEKTADGKFFAVITNKNCGR